jgi:mannose-6-phosphate isomerase-like protein (cupin superfamily)
MKTGETISNRETGERLTMLVSDEETVGARQFYQVSLPGRRPSPPLHYHLRFTETFSVIEGTLDVYLGHERRHVMLQPGESVTAQIRQLHTFANIRDQPAVIRVDTQPAGGVVSAFQVAYGVANDGGARTDGLPKNVLVRLIFIKTSEGFLPRVPVAIQTIVFNLATCIASLTGLQKRLAKYC